MVLSVSLYTFGQDVVGVGVPAMVIAESHFVAGFERDRNGFSSIEKHAFRAHVTVFPCVSRGFVDYIPAEHGINLLKNGYFVVRSA